MIPVVGLLGTLFAALGGYVLAWYHDLSKDERAEAARIACHYARQLYDRRLNQLSHPEKAVINELVEKHF